MLNKAVGDSKLRPGVYYIARCRPPTNGSAPHVVIANASCVQFAATSVWRQLGNTLEIYDYLLQHGAHVDVANATRHRPTIGKHDVTHKTGST